jgi:GT2 family glycosyltransferase
MTVEHAVTFDLVVASLSRSDELHALLASLERQSHPPGRVLLVDQNTDRRLVAVVEAHGHLHVERIESAPGLSRARNAALDRLEADVVGFPDDDCRYPDDLLERVARHFASDASVDAVTGRTATEDGATSGRWPSEPGTVGLDTLWHRCNSASTFVRRELLEAIGGFDERLGLGSGTPWSSGEEIDLMARALRAGARVDYDPSLVVWHPVRHAAGPDRRRLGRRDGGSVGYVLAKNRYPARVVARMLVRPLGGAGLSAARLDLDGVRFNAATLRGRVAGYRAGRRAARSSANNSS